MSREVVTSENFQQKVETGKVDEYKPPEKPVEESAEVNTKADSTKVETKVESEDEKDLPEGVKAKVDRIVGKKHREMKEAEEFAEREYNQRRAAEKQADQLKADRDALAAKLAEYEQKSRPEVAKEPPKQSDFETVDEYLDAKADYLVNKKLQEKEQADQQRIASEKARAIQNEFAKSLDEMQKKYPDFREVAEAADFDVPAHITQYLLESDSKAELGYHLSKMYRDDRKELDRILSLSPIRAIRELGKLEDSFSKPKETKVEREVPVSKAPAPISSALGNGTGVDKDPRDMNFQEYRAWKESQRRAGKKI